MTSPLQLEFQFTSFIRVMFGNPPKPAVTQPARRNHAGKFATNLREACQKWGVLHSQRNRKLQILRREARYTESPFSFCPA